MPFRSREASQLCTLLKPALVGQCWGPAAAAAAAATAAAGTAPAATAPAATLPQAAAAMLGLRCIASVSPVTPLECNYSPTQLQKAALARRQLQRRCPMHLFRLKGVTFDGRQDVIKGLRRGQALMFQREPSNPADPGAVHVQTLRGASVGYIAQNLTDAFVLPTCFGTVVSTGVAHGTDTWGLSAACCPSLHGVTLDLLPLRWEQQTDMQQVFGESGWQQLQQQVLKRYQHRCAVTSIPAAEVPLQVVPQWQFDHHKKQVLLAELIPVCEPVLDRQQLVQRYIWGCAEKHEPLKPSTMLQPFMHWRSDDELSYMEFAELRQSELWFDRGGWQLQPPAADKWLAAAAAAAADEE